jgi:LemA protein
MRPATTPRRSPRAFTPERPRDRRPIAAAEEWVSLAGHMTHPTFFGAVSARLFSRFSGFSLFSVFSVVASLAFAFTAFSASGCQKYDELIEKDQVCDQRWADMEAQLQRRYDLVPNLVSTVKASAKHEEDTLAAVTNARASATSIKLSADDLTDPAKMAAFQKAQEELKGSLSRLMMVQEKYPDLRANAAFHDLQVQLEGTENRILRSREQYNQAVREFNSELGKVGGSVVNKATGRPFKARVYFSASAESQAAPKVTF